jgi:23S rRNA G2445 N2-methylase RlmL
VGRKVGRETGSETPGRAGRERRGKRGEPGREAPPDRRAEHVSQLKLQGLYRGMAEAMARFHGWSVVFLSGNAFLEQAMHVKPEVSHRLWNGPLEVKLLKYRIR